MAAGSRTKFALDLDDIIAFPDAGHIPVYSPAPGENWIMLLEITADASIMRPVYKTRCKLGTPFIAAFYTSNPARDANGCKVGNVLCLTSARPKTFLDGQVGFRIEDPSTVEVLPVSMATLRELNQNLVQRSNEGKLDSCLNCDLPSRKSCAQCKTRYCTRDCQRTNWPTHKAECKALKALHRWNRTDWDNC